VNETAARFIDEIAAFDEPTADHVRKELEALYADPALIDASDAVTWILKQPGHSIGDRYYEIRKILDAARPKSARAKCAWRLPALLAWR
jgi:hypothetical protein